MSESGRRPDWVSEASGEPVEAAEAIGEPPEGGGLPLNDGGAGVRPLGNVAGGEHPGGCQDVFLRKRSSMLPENSPVCSVVSMSSLVEDE